MSLHPEWKQNPNSLERAWKLKNFRQALTFVNSIGAVSEEMKHHPDIEFGWGYVRLKITTHDIGGKLSEKDFLLAEKIDQLPQ
ncbi:MAG: 4a-hydroxytetrahydrobiopterin dehydratase [Bacteriovoracaceae bacterium]|nr:4a-hydroxytetrahydrobiopterin dehydratase [Bacteriovoracaceae bacterium]